MDSALWGCSSHDRFTSSLLSGCLRAEQDLLLKIQVRSSLLSICCVPDSVGQVRSRWTAGSCVPVLQATAMLLQCTPAQQEPNCTLNKYSASLHHGDRGSGLQPQLHVCTAARYSTVGPCWGWAFKSWMRSSMHTPEL